MKTLAFLTGVLVLAGLVTSPAAAGTLPKNDFVEQPQAHRSSALWKASLFVLAGSVAADMATSWHKSEANPLMQSSRGTFDGRSAAIRITLVGSGGILSAIHVHRHPEAAKTAAVFNFMASAVCSGLAAHNVTTH